MVGTNVMADVANSDAFSLDTLVASINKIPYVPNVIGNMGLFKEEGISTVTTDIELQGSSLVLIPDTPRGAPGTPISSDKRKFIHLDTAHLPATASIFPGEVQGVRKFGTTDQMETLEDVRDKKLTKMSRALDLTLEYHRLGALQGLVLDADGSVLINLYTAFDIEARSAVSFDFSSTYDVNDPTSAGAIRKLLSGVSRDMTTDLEMGGMQVSRVGALCGDTFWDSLISAPEILQTYLYQQQVNAAKLSGGLNAGAPETLTYGNCTFINYRGNSKVAIDTDNVQFFPMDDIPDLFKTYFAPADYMETANTIGLPKYARVGNDPSGFNKFVQLEAQSNPLSICTRPRMLRKGTLGTSNSSMVKPRNMFGAEKTAPTLAHLNAALDGILDRLDKMNAPAAAVTAEGAPKADPAGAGELNLTAGAKDAGKDKKPADKPAK